MEENSPNEFEKNGGSMESVPFPFTQGVMRGPDDPPPRR